jgi:1-acyl-sn-glycerol-3-phosphate acyltransferase
MVRFRSEIVNFYYWLGYHLSRLLARLFFGFRIIHRERVIQTGPVILAMNHQSFFDPPLAGNACDRPIFFLAKKSLMNVPVLGWLLPKLNVIPVNLEGGDRSALKALIRILSAGDCALVFPEGSRTPDGNLHPALPGLGLLIAKTRSPVVPMRIFGAFDAWPIHGKIHLGRKITIVIGEPIYFSDADLETGGKDRYARLSQRVMDAIAALHLPEEHLRRQDRHRMVSG